jgi:murein DD-endopeptidase MepM/ murein hydrolase activator NlpD
MPVTVQLDRSTLNERETQALAILENLPDGALKDVKQILELGMPDVIGLQTVQAFLTLCQGLGLDLSTNGVNQFKDEHQLGNTGDLQGKIGKQTAEVYLQTLLVLLDRQSLCTFPFSQLPNVGWTGSPRGFAANRNHGARAHAGCDLYFPIGTIMHAVCDGIVTQGPYPFYLGTYALEVDHGDFLVRYGEVQAGTLVSQGAQVERGQPIAKVGRLQGLTISMLHMEMYGKSATGPLTVMGAASKRRADGVPFMRRKDLIDPTPYLNEWQQHLP